MLKLNANATMNKKKMIKNFMKVLKISAIITTYSPALGSLLRNRSMSNQAINTEKAANCHCQSYK